MIKTRWIPVIFKRRQTLVTLEEVKKIIDEYQNEIEELNRHYIMSEKAADACIEKLEKENKKLKKLLKNKKAQWQ